MSAAAQTAEQQAYETGYRQGQRDRAEGRRICSQLSDPRDVRNMPRIVDAWRRGWSHGATGRDMEQPR
jgi:hypothetical protein